MATQAVTVRPEDLRAAAQILRQRGHTTDTYVDGSGRVCLAGAIRTAIAGTPNFFRDRPGYEVRRQAWEAEAAVGWYLRKERLLGPDDQVTDWNDLRCTGADEAVAVLEAFAAELEADGS